MITEITLREAVALTGYTRQHIYNLIVNGRLAARKVPSGKGPIQYLVNRAALMEYSKKQTQPRGPRT